jgi:hypothetical protein
MIRCQMRWVRSLGHFGPLDIKLLPRRMFSILCKHCILEKVQIYLPLRPPLQPEVSMINPAEPQEDILLIPSIPSLPSSYLCPSLLALPPSSRLL